ncbi:FprA family A-type flavoprotein [Myxococcota bacterium]|nr:FprA family A-type flavoprotein [Myxococcota bacterium]
MLFDDGVHSNVLLHDFGRGLAVQANQYLIVHDGQGMILDPGGPKVYPNLFAEMTQHISPKDLKYIFLSHQDPDIGTSINAWLMDTPAQAVISRLWMRFLPHFGIDKLLEERMTGIPDEGMILDLGGAPLVLLPAHFLHSPGNFQVYDPRTKVLFSGDLGASVDGESGTVEDFDAHARSMLGFHRRYMASEKAMNAWVKMVRTLDVEVIAPQHGPLFQGRDMVQKFIGWCEGLRCGVDLVDRYVVPSPGP